MRRGVAALAAAVVLCAGVVGCGGRSKDDIARDCVKALRARADGDTSRPKACDGLSHEDYTMLVAAQALKDADLQSPSPLGDLEDDLDNLGG